MRYDPPVLCVHARGVLYSTTVAVRSLYRPQTVPTHPTPLSPLAPYTFRHLACATPPLHPNTPQLPTPRPIATDNAVAGASTRVHTRATRRRHTRIILLLVDRRRAPSAIPPVSTSDEFSVRIRNAE